MEENFITCSFQVKRAHHATRDTWGNATFWSGVRKEWVEILDQNFYWGFHRKRRQRRGRGWGLASLNDVGRFWAAGLVRSRCDVAQGTPWLGVWARKWVVAGIDWGWVGLHVKGMLLHSLSVLFYFPFLTCSFVSF